MTTTRTVAPLLSLLLAPSLAHCRCCEYGGARGPTQTNAWVTTGGTKAGVVGSWLHVLTSLHSSGSCCPPLYGRFAPTRLDTAGYSSVNSLSFWYHAGGFSPLGLVSAAVSIALRTQSALLSGSHSVSAGLELPVRCAGADPARAWLVGLGKRPPEVPTSGAGPYWLPPFRLLVAHV